MKLIDTFPTHLFIEMYYGRKNNFGLIFEQTVSYDIFKLLCEEYGLFNGCNELANEIMSAVGEAHENTIRFKPQNNTFINQIIIRLTKGRMCSFILNASKFDDNGKYNPLILNLGVNAYSDGTMKGCVMHELTHAYENYMRNVNNAEDLQTISKRTGYAKNPISMAKTYAGYKKHISYLLYHLADFERNAYLAEIHGLFKNCDETFKNIGEALSWIKNTTPYQNYKTVFQWGEKLCNVQNKHQQQEILNYTAQLSNLKFKNYNQFTKWLRGKIIGYEKKFNTIIPKMAAKYIKMEEMLNAPITQKIQ